MSQPEIESQQAVQTLYQQHHGWLVQLLRRKMGADRDHAMDLAHDTFERVMSTGVRRALEEPRGYLGTIAKRLAIDAFRRRALEQAYLEALVSQPAAVAPSPETCALVIEALMAVYRVMDAMPLRMRRIFIMAQAEGLPYADIATALDISVNVVQKDMIKAWKHCYEAVYD